MGSEWIIVGYLGFAFLSLYFFKILQGNRTNNAGGVNSQQSLEQKTDPFTFALQLLCIGMYLFSIIGMAKGVIESYDNCEVVINSTFTHFNYVNETTGGNPIESSENILHNQTTTNYYDRVCFDNAYNEDMNLYNLSYWNLSITVGIVIVAMVWLLLLFLKTNFFDRIKGGFRK